jgi:hypothetical protein
MGSTIDAAVAQLPCSGVVSAAPESGTKLPEMAKDRRDSLQR